MTESLDPTPHLDPFPAPHPPPRYRVAVLYYGAVDREHERCMQAIEKHPYVFDTMELCGCPYIDMGRSICATSVLDRPEIGGLLFIDHDMVFAPSEIEKVIESAEACRGVVGAAYSMRRPGKIIGCLDSEQLPTDKKVVFFEGGEPLPAEYLGMGMTAIHRSVFERLVERSTANAERRAAQCASLRALIAEMPLDSFRRAALQTLEALEERSRLPELARLTTGISDAPTVPFFSHLLRMHDQAPAGTVGLYLGEDVSFCLRCHDAGIPVLMDTRARVYHKGSYCYGLEDVGMEVPYCDRLEVLDTGKRDPIIAPALFSQNPAVQAELERSYPTEALHQRPEARPHPEGSTP